MRDWHAEFEQLAMPHAVSLLRLAHRLTGERESAEDLVQETLLHAWRAFPKLPSGSNIRAWLFRILLNNFHDRGRLAGRPLHVLPMQIQQKESGLTEALMVEQSLDRLPVEHRTVLLLGVVEGFTCREIAEMLAIPIGTVMSRMNRARESMRKRLSPEAEKVAR